MRLESGKSIEQAKFEGEDIFSKMTVEDANKVLISKTQENCKISTFDKVNLGSGEHASIYVHNEMSSQIGSKLAVVVLS